MGSTVVITGAARGLGLCLVDAFLAGGATVIAGTRAGEGSLRARLERGGRLTVVPLDVTDAGAVRSAATEVSARIGPVDVLVNNAGIYPPLAGVPLADRDLGDGHLERTMQVNAFGPLRVTQAFLPLLDRGTGKTILNVSSEAGSIGGTGRTCELEYGMSKAALNMETKLLANALGPRGYRVLAVHPGWLQTDMGGPAAILAPETAARAILRIATGAAPVGNGAFVDHLGNALPW